MMPPKEATTSLDASSSTRMAAVILEVRGRGRLCEEGLLQISCHILAANCTCHVESKRQIKVYEPQVTKFKIRKYNFRVNEFSSDFGALVYFTSYFGKNRDVPNYF